MGCLKLSYYNQETALEVNPKFFGNALEKKGYSDFFRLKTYTFGFGGHEKDDEVSGSGNHLSFGDYGYNPRIGRRWRPDPLQAGMPSWSPYVYSLDNPIVFVDEEGQWPGVTYFFFEFDIGGGLGYGLNYVEQTGIAYDEIGKTHFTMTSALYIANQNLEEGSSNPEIVSGASVGLSAGVTFDGDAETFTASINGYNGELGGIEVYGGVGGEIGFGEGRFTAKVGLGVGVKLSVINTQVEESISLTDAQADIVSDATDVVTESWLLNGVDYNQESKLWEGTVATRNTKGKLIDSGIKVSSSNVVNDDGTSAPSGVWTSKSYRKEAAEVEK